MKNRNFYRVLSLALALLMLFAVVACTNEGNPNATTGATTANGTTANTTAKTTAAKTTAKKTTAASTTAKPVDPVDPNAPSLYSGVADISWFDASKSEFVLTTADQFMGFLSLRADNTTFEGMTVKLDVDVVINEGTAAEILAAGGPNACLVFNSAYQFKGIFDGQEHTISGTYQKATTSCVRGLFGAMGDNAVIKNVTIKNHAFSGPTADKNTYGVITPRISGENVLFSNIHVVDALLQKDTNVLSAIGGLAGRLDADKSLTIENCTTSGLINFEDGAQAGGLVGLINAGATLTVKNSSSSMNLTVADIAGGLVGQVNGKFFYDADCKYTGTITVPEGASKGEIYAVINSDAFCGNNKQHASLDAEGKLVEENHTWTKEAELIPWCTVCGYKRENISSYEGAVTELKENTPYYILSGVTFKEGAGTPVEEYSVQYVEGTISSNKLKGTSNKAEAQAYMLEKVADKENRYYIYFMNGDVKTYLIWGTDNGGSSTSQVYTTTTVSEKCIWYINADELLIYAEGTTQRYLGCFETADFRVYSPTNFGTYSDAGKGYYTAWFVPAA